LERERAGQAPLTDVTPGIAPCRIIIIQLLTFWPGRSNTAAQQLPHCTHNAQQGSLDPGMRARRRAQTTASRQLSQL